MPTFQQIKDSKIKSLTTTIRQNQTPYKSTTKESPIKFQYGLIEFLESELVYQEDLSMVKNVYKALLEHCVDYRYIFDQNEKDLLFTDMVKLMNVSFRFSQQIHAKISTFYLVQSSQAVKLLILQTEGINNLLKFDLGEFITLFLFELQEFKRNMFRYSITQEFRMKLLYDKKKLGGPLMERWLREANVSKSGTTSPTKILSLEELLLRPIQRLTKYPLLLKQLIDNSDNIWTGLQKHNMNVALIKVNHLLQSCNSIYQVNNWLDYHSLREDVEKYKLIKSPSINNFKNELKLSTSINDQCPNIVNQYENVFTLLQNLSITIDTLLKGMIKFTDNNCKYSKFWNDFLYETSLKQKINNNEDVTRYIQSSYLCYQEKTMFQKCKTIELVLNIRDEILVRHDLAIEICNQVNFKIKTHSILKKKYIDYMDSIEKKKGKGNDKGSIFKNNRKTMSMVQTYIHLGNQLKEQLPLLTGYIKALCWHTVTELNRFNIKWIESIFGRTSVQTHRDINDVIDFYQTCKWGDKGDHSMNM